MHCRLGNVDSRPIPYQVCHFALHRLICMPLVSLKIGGISLRVDKEFSPVPSAQCGLFIDSQTFWSLPPAVFAFVPVSGPSQPLQGPAHITPSIACLSFAFQSGFSFLLNLCRTLVSFSLFNILLQTVLYCLIIIWRGKFFSTQFNWELLECSLMFPTEAFQCLSWRPWLCHTRCIKF